MLKAILLLQTSGPLTFRPTASTQPIFKPWESLFCGGGPSPTPITIRATGSCSESAHGENALAG